MAADDQLRNWFNSVDQDRDGVIKADELRTALEAGGLKYSLNQAGQLVRMFDRDNKAALTYEQYTDLHNWLMQVRESFIQNDVGKKRSLTYSEVQAALQAAGFIIDATPFRRLCDVFDPTRSGHIFLEQFVGMCAFLKGASAAFRAFDGGGRGVVELDFGQLIYVGTFLR